MTQLLSSLAAGSRAAAPAIAALNQLAEVLARENAALRQRNRSAIAALADEKKAALEACESHASAVVPASDGVARLDSVAGAVADEIKHAKARLGALIDENQRRLRVAIIANQRLVETIAAAVQAQASGTDGYARNGRKNPAKGRASAPPPALTLYRSL